MSEKEKTKKEGEFDPEVINDIYDEMHSHNFALRAFGTLLRHSDLVDFADTTGKDFDAYTLRCGLSQIIELYLSHQERLLSAHVEQYKKSDAHLVKQARISISVVEQGAFRSKEVAVNHLRDAVNDLDIVIERNGELQDKAMDLKRICLDYIKQLSEKKAA